jgi:hypothetical protein
MKKQTTKKLELAKETLQNLEDNSLEFVAGGRPKTTKPTIC